jgi:hypothetical protein
MRESRRSYIKKLIKSAAGGAVAGVGAGMEMKDETSIKEFMGKNCARYVLNPEPHINPQAVDDIDIKEFTENFSHELDEMNGLYNVVRDVSVTVNSQSGDCVDFSAVACSWLIRHRNAHPRILVYAPADGVDYGHINVYDGNGKIYDYHGIYNNSPKGYSNSYSGVKLVYKTHPVGSI